MKNYWENITKIKQQQTDKGLSKYGQVLEQNTTLTPEEQITYLQEELIDGLMYSEHLKTSLKELFDTSNIAYTADTYQKQALRTKSSELDYKDTLVDCALGLSGETGELVDHIKKVLYHGHELDKSYVLKETGDILWYVAVLLDELGYTLSSSMIENIEKLKKRYPEGFDCEKSKNREEYNFIEPKTDGTDLRFSK